MLVIIKMKTMKEWGFKSPDEEEKDCFVKEASFIFNKYMEMGDCCLFIVIFRIKKAES